VDVSSVRFAVLDEHITTIDKAMRLINRPLVAIQNGIAQGGGAAFFTSNSVLQAIPMNPADFPPDCLAAGLAGSTLSGSLVLMYNDGSLLSLAFGPGAFFCSDGTFFTVDGGGAVTGSEKRFAGATGNFSLTAESTPPRVVADLEIDLDYCGSRQRLVPRPVRSCGLTGFDVNDATTPAMTSMNRRPRHCTHSMPRPSVNASP